VAGMSYCPAVRPPSNNQGAVEYDQAERRVNSQGGNGHDVEAQAEFDRAVDFHRPLVVEAPPVMNRLIGRFSSEISNATSVPMMDCDNGRREIAEVEQLPAQLRPPATASSTCRRG